MNSLNLRMILACDKQWGIGIDGGLLTHIPADLAFFKEKTVGGLIIVGRKTANSFPGGKALPDRINAMLSTTETAREGFVIVRNLGELCNLIESKSFDDKPLVFDDKRVYVVGGGEIYSLLLPYTNSIFVTKMDAVYDADTFFIDLDEDDDFALVSESESITENGVTFRFCEYVRHRNNDAKNEKGMCQLDAVI